MDTINHVNAVTLTGTATGWRLPGAAVRMEGALAGRPGTLEEAVENAVEAVADVALHPLATDTARPLTQARALLALLARCYAEQIYSSATVASLAGNEPGFLWPWWESSPVASAIGRFREENRAALQQCLQAALQFQVEEKIVAGRVTRVNRPQLAEEARRRITIAAFADSLEMDAE